VVAALGLAAQEREHGLFERRRRLDEREMADALPEME
jgi:hypothetical protein